MEATMATSSADVAVDQEDVAVDQADVAVDQPSVEDVFNKTIDSYEHRVGHVCRQVAAQIPFHIKKFPRNGTLLDNACGIGAVTQEFLKSFPTTQVSAIDIASSMVDAYKHITKQSSLLTSQVKDVQLGNAEELPFPDDHFDASIMNFAIFFLPDALTAVKEIHRTLKTGGTAIITVFKSFGFLPILDEVQNRVCPKHRLVQMPVMGPWCDASRLEIIMKDAGFDQPRLQVADAKLWGKDPEDFKLVLLESFSLFVARAWSKEEKEKLAPAISYVIDDMIKRREGLLLRDGQKVGCRGDAWIALATK